MFILHLDSLSYRATAGDKRNDPLYFDESALAGYRGKDWGLSLIFGKAFETQLELDDFNLFFKQH